MPRTAATTTITIIVMSSKLETILTSDNNNLPIQHVSCDLETGTVYSRGSRLPLKGSRVVQASGLYACIDTIIIYVYIHAYIGFGFILEIPRVVSRHTADLGMHFLQEGTTIRKRCSPRAFAYDFGRRKKRPLQTKLLSTCAAERGKL